MKLEKLELALLRIPFRVSFKHASAERSMTQSVFVTAQSLNNNVGYGEGCPRQYVTGESEQTAIKFFREYHNDLVRTIHDLHSLRKWCDMHHTAIDRNPAAWCAIEIALLDLMAKEKQQTIESLLQVPELNGPFVYSAVLGAMDSKSFSDNLLRYQKLGLQNYKIKLSGNIVSDRSNIAILRESGVSPSQVRADANNMWTDPDTAENYLISLDFAFYAIEEPLQPGQFEGLIRLSDSLETRIVVDESITQQTHLEQLARTADRWIVNIRVSKMGGLLRSLTMAQHCRILNLPIIVGAQVGETSILTRTALLVAQTSRAHMLAQEGAFGTLLLESDVVKPTLMFGMGGELNIDSIRHSQLPGLGLIFDKANKHYLEACT